MNLSWSIPLVMALIALPAAGQGDGFFMPRASLSVPRQELACAGLGGLVYAAGGIGPGNVGLDTVERYDPATDQWNTVAPMPTRLHHFGLAACGGKLYAVGGYSTSSAGTSNVYRYDPATNVWTAVAPLPRPRAALVAVELGGRVYAVGGVHPTAGLVGDLTAYDPLTDTWSTLRPMPTWREHLAAAVLGGKLWACGGRRVFGLELTAVERYDPATDTWTRMPDLPIPHAGTGAAALRGRLIVFGGERPGFTLGDVHEFYPPRGTWRRITNLSLPVHGTSPATLGDSVLIAGGGVVVGFGPTAAVQAFSYLPDGVRAYGVSTHCGEPIHLGTTAPPLAGQFGFGWLTSADLPPQSFGMLALAPVPDAAGTPLLGATIFVGLPGLVALAVPADARGVALLPGPSPLPTSLQGLTFFAQGGWLAPGQCTPLLTSDAIEVTIQ